VQNLKQVIVIAATNRPDMLDPALIRPGRVDRKIYVPPPDALSRKSILQLELKKLPIQEEIDLETLIQSSEGFSGAEIVAFCNDAVMEAIERQDDFITFDHLWEALKKVKPQITPEMIEFYRNFAAKNR
jgi:transitional endoplasmic reticulum ATPase